MINPKSLENLRPGQHIPRNCKHPNGYLTPKIKRFLKKKITYEDPETQQLIKGNVGDALMWRLILNGTQGDNVAIKEILDRVDGKLIAPNEEPKSPDIALIFITPQERLAEDRVAVLST